MYRLNLKHSLIKECSDIFLYVSRFKMSLPLSFRLKIKRTIIRDFSKGLKQINKKCPIYVELPKLKTEDYKTYSSTLSDSTELVVTDPTNLDPTTIIDSDFY